MAAPDASHRQDKRAVVLAWAVLAAATLAAWLLSLDESPTTADTALVVAIAALSAFKCRLILHYFMEIRHAPRWLAHATDAWLAVLWLTLLTAYLS